jgi:hypothetical protein
MGAFGVGAFYALCVFCGSPSKRPHNTLRLLRVAE